MEISKTAIAINNLFFLSVDVAETFRLLTTGEMNLAKINWDKKVEPTVLRYKWASKDLLKAVRGTEMQDQLGFGRDADNIIKIMLLLADRIGNDEAKMQSVFDFIETMPSAENLNLKKFRNLLT